MKVEIFYLTVFTIIIMIIYISYDHFNSIKSFKSMNLNNTIDIKGDELKIDKMQKLPDAIIIGVSKCG